MQINQKKLNRQLERQNKWMRSGCSSTLEACTGFGKTYEAILIIQRLHKKYPDTEVNVVVPGLDLLDDWIKSDGHIAKHNLNNVYVYVVNTYITAMHRPVLLVLDEVHHYASDKFGKVFECAGCVPLLERKTGDPFILALTATIERIDGKHAFLAKYCPVVDTVTLEEAKREGYISQFTVFNWGLNFSKEDQEEYEKQDSIFKNAFAKFEHNFDLAMCCAKAGNLIQTLTIDSKEITTTVMKIRLWYAQQHEWDGTVEHFWSPSNIAKYAMQFSASMRARKNLCHVANVKITALEQLFHKYPVKTIVFSENSKYADKVEETFGKDICRAYHTYIESETIQQEIFTKKGTVEYKPKKLGKAKTKERIKELFKKGSLMILSTVRSLNEGFDFAGIRLGVMASYNSSKKDDTQRTGRASRFDNEDIEKEAIVVNFYIIGSQEEKWLRAKQAGKRGMIWVTSIDEINLGEQLSINLADRM